AEEITEYGHSAAPGDGADDIEGDIAPVAHLRHPGEYGHEGPHDRDESGEDDRFGAVFLEEFVRFGHIALLEEAGVLFVEQRRADRAADPVTTLIAGEGDDRDRGKQDPERHRRVLLRRQQTTGEQQRIAGQQREQQTRFDEDDYQDRR